MYTRTNCVSKNGTIATLQMLQNQDVDVVFGPYCSAGKLHGNGILFMCLIRTPTVFYHFILFFKIATCTVLVWFLRASAMLKHVIDIGWTSVRPSVCPSVTSWYCIKTAEHIVMLSASHDSAFILVFCVKRSSRNSDGVTPCGVLNTAGV